jgi:hypothetical protein
MSNKDFAKSLQLKLQESGAFGYQPSVPVTPVVQAEWPSKNNEIPSSTMSVVTNGETTPIDEPRTDIAAQNNATNINEEVKGEVASLLISIGYILSQAGAITDKYDYPAIVSFLSNNFNVASANPVPQEAPTDTEVDAVAVDDRSDENGEEVEVTEPNDKPFIQTYMESRRLIEKKIIKG